MKMVSNSTPLIALARIEQVNLLHAVFGRIIIPQGVYNEVVLQGADLPSVKEVREATWIENLQVQDALAFSLLRTDLDQGEAEAIVLAKEVKADYLGICEEKIRCTDIRCHSCGGFAAGKIAVFNEIKRQGVLDWMGQ
jgi:predicted nucleic acid-binding protein